MRRIMKWLVMPILTLALLAMPLFVLADELPLYGSSAAAADTDLTLEDMLIYAIQDEYHARAEYEAILEEFGETAERPFARILDAEERHIASLEKLLKSFDFTVPNPADVPEVLINVPDNLAKCYAIGSLAEENNIAMYETFLTQIQVELPDKVADVFTNLQEASKSHLIAFDKAATRPHPKHGE